MAVGGGGCWRGVAWWWVVVGGEFRLVVFFRIRYTVPVAPNACILLEGVRDRDTNRMVAAVNACLDLGGVLQTCESSPGKAFWVFPSWARGAVKITHVRLAKIKPISVL